MARRGRRIPQVLSISEQKKLLNSFNTKYLAPLRNKALVRLMLTAGLRLSEAINLKWQNISFQTGQLKVVEGKGRKDRNLWLGEGTLDLLKVWRERQIEGLSAKGYVNENNYVFTTNTTGRRLNAANVRQMIYRHAENCGIQEVALRHYRDKEGNKLPGTYKEKKVTPHTLRHTFATDLYRNCLNIRRVQKALGHADLSTTMIYTHLVDEKLERDMKALDGKFD